MRHILLISTTIFLFLSCKKNDNPSVPLEKSIKAFKVETSQDSIIFKPNAIFVKSDINSRLSSIGLNTITFDNSESLSLINDGDVLYSEPTDKAPNGYALKVLSRTAGGSSTTYTTELACYEDVYTKISQRKNYSIEQDALKTAFYKTIQDLPDFHSNLSLEIENTINTTKAANFLERTSKRIKSTTLVGNEATMQYIFWDKDGQFETTTNDQVILELKLKYSLENTHLFFENGYFDFQGIHSYDLSAYFIFAPTTSLTEQDKRDFKERLKGEVLGKRFNVVSIPLTPTSATNIVIKPTLDIFYKIGFDITGEFKIGGELKNFRYNFRVNNLNPGQFDFKPTGAVLNQGVFTGKVEALAEVNINLSFGIGITFKMPAFEYEKGKASYVGLYTDIGCTFKPTISGSVVTNGQICANIDLPYDLDWKVTMEGSLGIFRRHIAKPKLNIYTNNLFNGTLGTYNWCTNITNINITDDLIAYYPFNNSTNDLSGNSNNGTINGGFAYTFDRNNQPNRAADFNGSDAYITVPPSLTLNSITKQTDASFICWFKTDSWNNIGGHISKNDNGNDLHYRFLVNETGTLLQVEQPYGYGNYSALQPNRWYHFAAIKSGTTAKFYLDGVVINTTTMINDQWASNFNTNLEIGRDAHGPVEYTRGAMDEIRIYKRALNQAEILRIKNE
jgi:hypothetical protein